MEKYTPTDVQTTKSVDTFKASFLAIFSKVRSYLFLLALPKIALLSVLQISVFYLVITSMYHS